MERKRKAELDHYTSRLDRLVAELPRQCTEEILKHCEVNGALPLLKEDVAAMFTTFSKTLEKKFESIVHSGLQESRSEAAAAQPAPAPQGVTVEGYFFWGGASC
jgi:hypothetical protein